MTILKPIIIGVEIINIDDDRIVKKDVLESTLKELSIPYKDYISTDKEIDYLVFGSFSVAEKFLKGYVG